MRGQLRGCGGAGVRRCAIDRRDQTVATMPDPSTVLNSSSYTQSGNPLMIWLDCPSAVIRTVSEVVRFL